MVVFPKVGRFTEPFPLKGHGPVNGCLTAPQLSWHCGHTVGPYLEWFERPTPPLQVSMMLKIVPVSDWSTLPVFIQKTEVHSDWHYFQHWGGPHWVMKASRALWQPTQIPTKVWRPWVPAVPWSLTRCWATSLPVPTPTSICSSTNIWVGNRWSKEYKIHRKWPEEDSFRKEKSIRFIRFGHFPSISDKSHLLGIVIMQFSVDSHVLLGLPKIKPWHCQLGIEKGRH